MITIYRQVEGNSVAESGDISLLENLTPGVWIDVIAPSYEDLIALSKATNINQELLLTTLDSEESSHIESEGDDLLIVLDAPIVVDHPGAKYETIPISIAYNDDYLVTITVADKQIAPMNLAKNRKFNPASHTRFTLMVFNHLAALYINYLKKIEAKTRAISIRLRSSYKNKELYELLDFSTTMVYFSTSINADIATLMQLKRLPSYKKEVEIDLIEDVEIELNQARDMATVYRDVLSGTMDAFASVISNNLNIVMKTFAIVSIVLSVPSIISGIYGMNVTLPLSENRAAIWILLAISGVLALIAGLALFLYQWIIRRK
ncbi:MAG: magnesium transporter CorA family protein [Bacilli bacterium]|jgi:magnesium transporter